MKKNKEGQMAHGSSKACFLFFSLCSLCLCGSNVLSFR